MTLAIFVAGEEIESSKEEFPKYCEWLRCHGADIKTAFSCSDEEGSDSWISVPSAVDQPIVYSRADIEQDYTAVAIKKNDFLKSFTGRLRNRNNQFEKNDVESILKVVLRKGIIPLTDEPLEISIFAHWHVSPPQAAEQSFNQQLSRIDLSSLCERKISRIKSYAVSTRRKRLFDLGKDVLDIPSNRSELSALVDLFEKESAVRSSIIAEADIVVSESEVPQTQSANTYLIIAQPGAECDGGERFADILRRCGVGAAITLSAIKNEKSLSGIYPLFFGDRQTFDELGFAPPEEFIIADPLSDSVLSENNENVWKNLILDVARRTEIWVTDMKSGVPVEVLRDWCAGAFRIFCGFSKDVHGVDSLIDVSKEQLSNDSRAKLQKRFAGKDVLRWQLPLWKSLFARETRSIRKKLNNTIATKWREIFTTNNLVEPLGGEIAFASPTGKINLLLIDDDIRSRNTVVPGYRLKIPNRKDARDKWRANVLKDVFFVTALKIKIDGDKNNFTSAVKSIKEYVKANPVDAVLLDLHLGNSDDPAGYQLIRMLKILLPTIPVVVYSRYDDMGHIARAFKMGATWYIRKDDVYKLPRHFISLLMSKGWRDEWKSIVAFGLCDDRMVDGLGDFVLEKDSPDFLKNFNEKNSPEWKYLTYKALERYPGQRMFLRPLGGGFSSAATFRVAKTDRSFKVGGKCAPSSQSPVIVKIDKEFNTRTEYERYFRFVRPYIANETGRVESDAIAIDPKNSAIVYTFAGKRGATNELLTLKEMMSKDIMNLASCRYEGYSQVLNSLFDNILPRIHHVPAKLECDMMYSSYPSVILGEKEADNAGFVGNYLSRMSLAKHYEVIRFNNKPLSQSGEIVFEFRSIIEGMKPGDAKKIDAIEVVDNGDGAYSKMTVILEGAFVDHVVRYRSKLLSPGKRLYAIVREPTVIHARQDDKLDDYLSSAFQSFVEGYAKGMMPSKDACILRYFVHPSARDAKVYFNFLFRSFAKIEENTAAIDFDSVVLHLYNRAMAIIRKAPNRFSCPQGIVHGDLNFANIMLDRKSGRGSEFDVWLIDFARTRRDVIAHDFNVFFTSTLVLLFKNELWCDARQVDPCEYAKSLLRIFHKFAVDSVFGDVSAAGGLCDVPPDYIDHDRRLKLVYQVLRRVRRAALDSGMSEDAYAMTTALCCLYTFRIFLRYEKNIQGAAALLAITHLCLKRFEEGGV